MMKRLQNVDQIIDAFGGAKKAADNNKAIASWLGLNTSAICNWRERKSIPSGWHLRFYLEAERLGMVIDPSVLGVGEATPAPAKKKHRGGLRAKRGVEFQAA
jgi:hypothetical protein